MHFEVGDEVKLPPYIIPQRGHVVGYLPKTVVPIMHAHEEPTTFVVIEIVIPKDGVRLIMLDELELCPQ